VVRRNKFAPGALFSIFFKSTGPVLIHHVERGETVDHAYYINNYLRPLANEIKYQRPSFGTHCIKILQCNGKPHIHKEVCDYLESDSITIVPYLPNLPDLSPCDFWLFNLIKQNLGDEDDAQSLHDAVAKFMYSFEQRRV
jgi:hypothetical protein